MNKKKANIFSLKDDITVESPGFADSIKEGDITFLKKVGDSVKLDEVIAKIETDKTAMEIAAPSDGVITELLVEEGATITAHLPVLKMKAGAGAVVPKAAPKPAAVSPPPPPPPPPSSQPKPVSSSLPEVPPVPKSPVSSVPISQIPVTPFKFEAPVSGTMDIKKIGGSRAETRVRI